MIQASGILLLNRVDNTDFALLIKRAGDGDFVGYWEIPGVKLEKDEDVLDAAERELFEEIGPSPYEIPRLLCRSTKTGVDFTTFVAYTKSKFRPTLNNEHDDFGWFPINDLPEKTHPGVKIAITRLSSNELDVAKAIISGDLVSPQQYAGFWLFDIRVTGTNVAYRSTGNEFVYRDPQLYLNDEFLARCNGLPVVWDHPERGNVDSREFSSRSVGAIFVPYIKGSEVWAIAKIYNAKAVRFLQTQEKSTSPGVILSLASGANRTITMKDGSTFLIEGKPETVDHLAICDQGVWDKAGPPQGVVSVTVGDLEMSATRNDADDKKEVMDADEPMNKVLKAFDAFLPKMDAISDDLNSKMDAFAKRMDALEAKMNNKKDASSEVEPGADIPGDPKEPAFDEDDKEKKNDEDEAELKTEVVADEDEPKDLKEGNDTPPEELKSVKADVQRALRDNDRLRKRLAELEKQTPAILSEAEEAALRETQIAFDSVGMKLGEKVTRPVQGEDHLGYVRRLTRQFAKYSPTLKQFDFSGLKDLGSMNVLAAQVRADAERYALTPSDLPEGTLNARVRVDAAGRQITEWHGHPSAWMNEFKGVGRNVSEIKTRHN